MLIHPFIPSARSTSPCDLAKSARTVPLPNGSKLPTASISAESSEEIFSRRTGSVNESGPQISSSPVPIFGVNSCNRGRLGVVLETGYKYKPLVFVIGIKQFHNKLAPCQLSSPSGRVIEFFERSHRSIDLRKYRQPCIMSSIMRWI
jgi:hypothetical protein